jgi:hypothetical protein
LTAAATKHIKISMDKDSIGRSKTLKEFSQNRNGINPVS